MTCSSVVHFVPGAHYLQEDHPQTIGAHIKQWLADLCVAGQVKRSPAKCTKMKSFQFTVFAAENGYRVRVKHGEEEYVWPDIYNTLEHAIPKPAMELAETTKPPTLEPTKSKC